MVDIHTHLLHNIDDGSASVNESGEMLEQMKGCGVHTVVCTPHFRYLTRTPEEFIGYRDIRLAELKSRFLNTGIRILSGCELELNSRMISLKDASPFCFEGTRNILVEMPDDRPFNQDDIELLTNFSDYFNVRPIIAHAERYYSVIKNLKIAEKILKTGAVIQIDGASLFDSRYKKAAAGLIKNGYASLVASDCHDPVRRRPCELARAYERIEKLFGVETVNIFKQNAEFITKSEKT